MYRTILIVVLVVSLSMVFFENASAITGKATEGSTTSEVTIQSYLAIQMSANLTAGIIFNDVESLPATNINATENYNGTGSSTLYFINVSTDSNSAVDFCLKADAGMDNGAGDIIGLNNETYSTNVTTSDANLPDLTEIIMTTTYDKTANAIPIGSVNYYRFWLDVPAGQATGTYTNNVFFRGVITGNICGA